MVRPEGHRHRAARWIGPVLIVVALLGCRPDDRPILIDAATTVPRVGVAVSGDTLPPDPMCASVPIGLQETTVEGGGVTHPVRILVPPAFRESRLPVVISWHGLGGDAAGQAALTGFEQLAETEGFIVAHPTGVPNAGDSRAAWQLTTSPPDASHDDVAFARALFDELIREWCVDSTRIYVAGMSNGGFFTARLVCEAADRIAAAISVGGVSHPDTCAPARPVPYLAVHGTADDEVPYTGDGRSALIGTGDLPSELFTSNVPAEFAEFASGAGCDPQPSETPFGESMVRRTYSSCDGNVLLTFVVMVGGGHVWPRSPDWPIDATVDGWAFVSQFRL